MNTEKNSPTDKIVGSSDVLESVFRVEHDYMTLRTPKGWLLWSQKINEESSLSVVLGTAHESLDIWNCSGRAYNTDNETKETPK